MFESKDTFESNPKRRMAMLSTILFGKEVYIRLSGDEAFTCTTRYAGLRVWARRFHCTEMPQVPSSTEQCEPGSAVRRVDHRVEADYQGGD